MARPPAAQAKIDANELNELMKFFPSIEETADWFKVSESSLQRFVKANFGMSFDCLRNKGLNKTRTAIRRAQINLALSGDRVMLIWTGKQYLGQSEKTESVVKADVNISEKSYSDFLTMVKIEKEEGNGK